MFVILLLLCTLSVVEQLRKHDDAWVFIDPVTEDIAPGYFEIVEVQYTS